MATKKRWSANVHTESTYPDAGLFKKGARTVAKSLASPEVSPKGPASGMRMLTFYINRAGKNLPRARIQVLERAKKILAGIIASQKEDSQKEVKTAAKKSVKKAAKKSAEPAARKPEDS